MRRFTAVVLTVSLCCAGLAQAAESLFTPASLRQQLPENTVAYLRIPSPFGWLSAEHDGVLKPAQAHAEHQKQVAKLLEGMKNNLLPQFKALDDTAVPLLNVLFSDLRSPVELAMLLPANTPPTSAVALMRAKLNLDSLEAANAWLQSLTQLPLLQIQQPFDAKGFAILKTDQIPLLLHYAPDTRQLHLMFGLLATLDSFSQTLAALQTLSAHPMFALEQPIDSSGQGLFAWISLEKLLPLVQAMLPPEGQQNLQKAGTDKARALAFGFGSSSSQGKGRLQLVLDAPKSGYRSLLPPINNHLALGAAGEPGLLLSLNVPLHALFKNLQSFAQTEMPSLQPPLQKFQQDFLAQTGVPLDAVLSAFGDEILVFSDEVGEFAAVRLANKASFATILQTLITKFHLQHSTYKTPGALYHQLIAPLPSFDEATGDGSSVGEMLALTLLKRLKSHYFWMEDGDYLVLAKVPQLLFDRTQHVNRVALKQWLYSTQKQAHEGSVLLLSANMHKMPRLMYSLYLQLLMFLGDVADTPIDMFALPAASELKLPDNGAYGINLFLGEDLSGLALTFENNPLEFLFNVYGGGAGAVAAAGILAAVAIPAYSDYLLRSKVAEGVGLLAGMKTPAEEFFGAKGHLPTVEEAGGKSSGKHTSRIYLLEDGSGYAAEFYDSALPGRILLKLDTDSSTWTCSSENMPLSAVPTACK